jgi:hypothetical protein
MPSLPATAHVLEDGRDARCASADGHRLPVPTRRRPPTPQPSAPKGAHEPTLTLRPIDQNRQAGFASGDGYPPTGPFKECSPASRYQAKWRWPISRDRDRSARTGNKLTNWGAPRPRRRTPCDARQHGNRQRHSDIGLRQPDKPPHARQRTASSNGSPASIASLPTVSGAFDSLLSRLALSNAGFPAGFRRRRRLFDPSSPGSPWSWKFLEPYRAFGWSGP